MSSSRKMEAVYTQCNPQKMGEIQDVLSAKSILQTTFVTAFSVMIFLALKIGYETIKQSWSYVSLVVIGGGPTGLLAAIIGIQTGRVTKLILFEEQEKNVLFNKPHQVGIDPHSVTFLRDLGVDFDNIEGCWQDGSFYTRIGVLIEYLLILVHHPTIPIEMKFGSKFTRDKVKEIEELQGRVVSIVCDGTRGTSAIYLGLSDEFTQYSCSAYGAVATVERLESCAIPTPEIRVHNLTFDINSYIDYFPDSGHRNNKFSKEGFHLKIFGSRRQRYMTLAIRHCEDKLTRTLRIIHDTSVMRNIFQVCYNKYKCEEETPISDTSALRYFKFSPRLFPLKVSHRKENVAYFQETDMFVLSHGEASRSLNFHTGMDMSLAVRELRSLGHFIEIAAFADSEQKLKNVLSYKHLESKKITEYFVKNGLKEYMFTG